MMRWLLLLPLLLSGCPDSSTGASADDLLTADLNLADGSGLPDHRTEVAVVCPPPEPHGLATGDRVKPLTFLDDTGVPVSLHDYCGTPLTLVYHYYGW